MRRSGFEWLLLALGFVCAGGCPLDAANGARDNDQAGDESAGDDGAASGDDGGDVTGDDDGEEPGGGHGSGGGDGGSGENPRSEAHVVWTQQFGATASDRAYGIVGDADGNVVVVGETFGRLVVDDRDIDYADAYVRKLDAQGNALWTRQFGSRSADKATWVAVDTSGNIAVSGEALGSLLDDEPLLSGAFVRLYDKSGVELWTRQFATPDTEASAVAIDASGNVVVAGSIRGLFPLPGESPAGIWDAFVRKYDRDGNELWSRQFGSPGIDVANALAVDALGNIIVAGVGHEALPEQAEGGPFVRKYDPDGQLLWTQQYEGDAGSDSSLSLDADGNILLTNYGSVRKYAPDGELLWSQKLDGGFAGAFDARGHLFVALLVRSEFAADEYDSEDIVVSEYDGAGTELWQTRVGSRSRDHVNGLYVADEGSLFIAGRSESFGDLPKLVGESGEGAFVMRLAR